MNNKIVSIGIGILLIVVAAGLVLGQKNAPPAAAADTVPAAPDTTTVNANSAPASAPGITSVEVAAHNSRQSCWSTINGNVYDLTSWIPQHPGGEQAILQLCGTDGSAKYNGQHGGAPKQAAILLGFKIGAAAR